MSETTAQRKTRYDGLRRKAEDALSKLVESDATPANTRAQAARTLLELVGAIGPTARANGASDAPDELEPASMTLGDIDAEIERLGVV